MHQVTVYFAVHLFFRALVLQLLVLVIQPRVMLLVELPIVIIPGLRWITGVVSLG
jgi:hypothetical protein